MPILFDEFRGQEHITNDLRIHIANSMVYNVPLEHSVLYGGPGLGKTTLAEAIAIQINRKLWQLTGKELTQNHLYDILLSVNYRDIVFIDEIHRCMISVIEILYGPLQTINNLKISESKDQTFLFEDKQIAPFTFIGATTAPGMIAKPLRDRFILQYQFQPYTIEALCNILTSKGCSNKVAKIISERSRGTPREALNFFLRLRNEAGTAENITPKVCENRFKDLNVDKEGFNNTDIAIIQYLKEHTTASSNEIRKALLLDPSDYHEMHEPFLLQKGIIQISSRGRRLTRKGLKYLEK